MGGQLPARLKSDKRNYPFSNNSAFKLNTLVCSVFKGFSHEGLGHAVELFCCTSCIISIINAVPRFCCKFHCVA